MSYTIIDVERQTGISSRTLRFWASKGLFPFTQLSEHGTRYFAQSDVEWAQWIECLRSLDMSIEDIRRYLYLFFARQGHGERAQKAFATPAKQNRAAPKNPTKFA